jgi:sn1-specific diacylglycerol lipase
LLPLYTRHGKLNEIKDKYSDYRIRIVGHSLGAGCAAALSVLLRPKFPNLRCLAFSPPGCVFSVNLAEECSEWLTSYILDADIVPRLAVDSFEDLRNEVLEMICRIKIPKHHVLRFRLPGFKDRETLSDFNSLALYKEDEIKDSKCKQQVEKFFEFQASVREKRKTTYIEMCPPGEIIQLFRTEQRKLFILQSRSNATEEPNNNLYTARWAKKEDFRKVIISSHMLADHDPINFKNQLQELAATQFGIYSGVFSDDSLP